jgi:hypothetical protein
MEKKYIKAHFWHVYVNQNLTCTFSVLSVSLSVCLSQCYGYENIEKKNPEARPDWHFHFWF